MKRYYLSNVIGDGNIDALPSETEGPHRPAVDLYGVSWVSIMSASDTETGAPLLPWCLVLVNADDHLPLMADSRMHVLPDVSLALKVSAINAATRTDLLAALAARGLPSSIVTGAELYCDVIRGIGQVLDAAFNESTFDIGV